MIWAKIVILFVLFVFLVKDVPFFSQDVNAFSILCFTRTRSVFNQPLALLLQRLKLCFT